MGHARILAAGGILWRDGERRQLAVVHRSRYGDWSLPKGKLDVDERFIHAARREVREETGWDVTVGEFAGEVLYFVDGLPKSVLFWNMTARGDRPEGTPDADEVASVSWLSVAEAVEKLSYLDERDLVRDNAGA